MEEEMADALVDAKRLESDLAQLEREITGKVTTTGTTDTRAMKIMIVLGRAIIRLDTTSARLARVNIILTGVILLVGIIQLVVMARGH
jgi:hypothetical protein